MITIGGKQPSSIKLGNKDVSKIFIGEKQVWPNADVITYEYTLNVRSVSVSARGTWEQPDIELDSYITSTKQKLVNGNPEGLPEDIPYTIETLSIAPHMTFNSINNTLKVGNNESESTIYAGFRVTQAESNKDGDITINQTSGVRVYELPVVDEFYYDERDAAGGTLTPSIAYHQNWRWNGIGDVHTVTSGGFIKASIKTPVSGASVEQSTGIVTWEANTGSAREVTVTITIGIGLKESLEYTAVAKQNADSISRYGDMVINSLSANDIPAAGGTISSGVVNYTQTVYYVSGKTTDITSGATVAYSAPVTAASLGTTVKERSSVGTLTATVTLNEKSATKEVSVYQAANAITSYGDLAGGSITANDIPASGGSVTPTIVKATQTIGFTSGATRAGNITNNTISAVTATSLGTTEKVRTLIESKEVTFTGEGGKTKKLSVGVYQQANTATYGDVTITGGTATDIPAGGGTVTKDNVTGYSSSQTVSYTSGSTRVGSVTNTLSGEVSAPNLGTEQKERSSIGLITITATGEGGKKKTKDVFIYQAANTVSYGDLTGGSVSVSDIPASGGKASDYDTIVNPSQVANYTSGATRNCIVSSSITSDEITAASLGTTVKARANLGTFSVLFTGEGGKSKPLSTTVYQQANSATYGNLTGGAVNVADIPASGGKAAPVVTNMMQTVSFTSGATRAGTVTNAISKDISAVSLGTTVKVRTLIDSANVVFAGEGSKTSSKSYDVYQSANTATYGELQGGSITASDAPANGNKKTATVVNATQTITFTSGSSRAGTVTFTAPTYGGENLGTTVKARTSLGNVSVTFTGEGSKTSTKSVEAFQEANTASYGDLTGGGLSAVDIPASGGTAKINVASASQIVSFTSGATRAGVITDRTPSSVSAQSLGTTVKARTKIDTASIVYTGEGNKTLSKSVDVYQAANVATYGELAGGSITASDIPAAGGSVTPIVAAKATQTVSFTSGSTRAGSVTNTTPTSVSATSLGTTLKARTKIDARTVTFTGEGSKTRNVSVDVYQQANTESYGNVTISGGAASDIPASGGTVNTLTGYSSAQTVTFTSGSTRAGVTSNAVTGSVQAQSLGTTVKARTGIDNLTITATGEGGKTASKNILVYQAANSATYGELTGGSVTASDIPAAGGSVTPTVASKASQTISFTSGATKAGTVTNTTPTAVSGSSLGTTVKARTKIDSRSVTFTGEGSKTRVVSVDVYQAANVATDGAVTVSGSYGTVAASGGVSNVTASATQAVSYTSGATSSKAVTNLSYAIKTAVTGASIASNGTITWANNTSTSARSVTVVITATGTSSKVGTKEVICSQSAGVQVFATPTISSYAYDERDAAGGTLTPKISYSQVWTWNGVTGSGGTITSGATISASIPTPVTGASVNASNGIVTWTANTGAVRQVTVLLTVTLNGKTSAASTAIAKQNADAISSYGDMVINSFTVADIPASGGTVSSGNVSYNQVVYYVSGKTTNITSGATITYSTGVTKASRGTTAGERLNAGTLTATVTLNGKSASKSATVYQAANAITSYGNVTVSGGTVNDIPASGGEVSSASGISISQIVTYTSGSTRNGTVNTTYSTKITGSSLGTTIKSRTKLGTLTATFTGEGSKTASKDFDVYQAANSITYGTPTVNLSYGDISAGGSTVNPSVSYSQPISYTSGSTGSVTSGGSVSYSGTSVNTSTGAVSANSLGTTVKARTKITTATANVTVNGKTASKSVDVYQAANSVTYGTPTVNASYSDISAGGSTVTPSISYSQTASYTSGSTASITSGGSLSYSGTGVSTSNGGVSANSLGTTVKARTKITAATISVSLNGKLGSKSVDVYQAANSVTYGTPTVNASYSDISAGGSTVTPSISYSQTASYTSGSSQNIISGGSVSYSGTSVNTSNGAVSASSLGTTVKSRTQITTATVSVSVNGKSGNKSVAVYQAANAITSYGTPNVSLWYGNISASGGTTNPSLSYSQSVNYTSGSSATLTSGGSVSYTGASNNTTGAVSANSKGTTASSTTTVANVTATVTMNGKSGSGSAAVYQNPNSVTTYGTPVVSMSYSDISSAGGSITPVVSFTQSVTYTSGSSTTISSGGTKSFSGTSVNTSTGSVSANSLGTTAKSRTRITTSTVSITVNGKTGTKAVDVYQAANSITTYGAVSLTNGSVADIPASGGSVSSASGLSYSQTITYSSGGSRSGSVSISYSSAVTAGSLGTTVKARTSVGTLTATATGEGGKTATKAFTVYQAANAITSTTTGTWTVAISANPTTIAATGGTSTITASASAPRTNHYTSGSTSSAGTTTATPTLSGSATGFTLSGTTVTVGENPNEAARSITVTASSNGASKSVTITQSASKITWASELSVTPSSLTFEAVGGTKTVSVVSRRQKQLNGKNTGVYENVPWTIT